MTREEIEKLYWDDDSWKIVTKLLDSRDELRAALEYYKLIHPSAYHGEPAIKALQADDSRWAK